MFAYIQMSLLLRVRGFYLLNKQEKNYHKIAWIAEIAVSQKVADRKGNAFIVEKMVKNCYAFSTEDKGDREGIPHTHPIP